MPLRINLLAEALAEEELRRRDPVKRAIYIGVLLLVVVLVWWVSTLVNSIYQKSTLAQMKAHLQSQAGDYNQVRTNLEKIATAQGRLDALDKLSIARFSQGNLLNALQKVYVTNMLLTRVRLEQNYLLNPGVASVTNSFGVVAGKPPTKTERIIMTLDAKDFSPTPGDQVNNFKTMVASVDYFKVNLDTNNGIRLANLSPPQSTGESKPFVLFSLECRFLDKTR